jgi:hypothetical protein
MNNPYYKEKVEFKISLPREFFWCEHEEDPENTVLFDSTYRISGDEKWLDNYPASFRDALIMHGKCEDKDPKNREFNLNLLEEFEFFCADWFKSSYVAQELIWNERESYVKEIWHEYRFSGLYNFISFHDFCIVKRKILQNYFAREYLKQFSGNL